MRRVFTGINNERTPEPPATRVPNPPLNPASGMQPGIDLSGFTQATTPTPAPTANPSSYGASGSRVTDSFGSMPNFAATDPARGQSDFTWGVLQGMASGKDVPFGEAEILGEKTQAKTAAENTYNQARDTILSQQAATGFASSPAAARPLVEARIGASQQYGKAANDINQAAAQNNYNARQDALKSAQQWVDSLRSYVAQMTGTYTQRQQAQAQLDLAQRQLDEAMRQFDIRTGLEATT